MDVIGDAKHDRYRAALDAVTADENVHQVVVIVTPQMMTDVEQIAQVIAEIKSYCTKPLIGCLMGLVDVFPAVEILREHGVPCFAFPEGRHAGAGGQGAVCRMGAAADQRLPAVSRSIGRPWSQLLQRELDAGRSRLVELPALEVLQHYGFPTHALRLGQVAGRGGRCRPRRSVFPW